MTEALRPVATPPLSEPSAWRDVTITVNGEQFTAQVESRLLLVDFLRHRLGLTGTHVGCEQGSCGACTVLIDGVAARSCLALAAQVDGSEIETVESLAADDAPLNELQEAFHTEHGLQCGFCTPGFLMSLTGLAREAERTGEPLDEDTIDEGLSGHLCRCTGYVNIRRAARKALLGRTGEEADR